MKKLTVLQKRTCDIYSSMKKPNQAKAHSIAGSKCRGKTLITEANRTLNKPQCAAYLKRLQKKLEKRAGKKADDIIAELEKIGFSNIQDFIGKDNEVRDISGISNEKAAAVESIQTDIRHDSGDSDGYTEKVRIKCYDKRAALVDLGKRFGLFPNKEVHKHTLDKKTVELLELIDGSTKGKLPNKTESKNAG